MQQIQRVQPVVIEEVVADAVVVAAEAIDNHLVETESLLVENVRIIKKYKAY